MNYIKLGVLLIAVGHLHEHVSTVVWLQVEKQQTLFTAIISNKAKWFIIHDNVSNSLVHNFTISA